MQYMQYQREGSAELMRSSAGCRDGPRDVQTWLCFNECPDRPDEDGIGLLAPAPIPPWMFGCLFVRWVVYFFAQLGQGG